MSQKPEQKPGQKPEQGAGPEPGPWRSLLGLSAGIILFIFLALVMVWLGRSCGSY